MPNWIAVLLGSAATVLAAPQPNDSDPKDKLTFELYAGIPVPAAGWSWDFSAAPVRRMEADAFAVAGIPQLNDGKGKTIPWPAGRVVLRGSQELTLPAGEYRFLVRTKRTFRLSLDGKPILWFYIGRPKDSCVEEPEPDPLRPPDGEPLYRAPNDHKQFAALAKVDGKPHRFSLEVLGGTPKPDMGEITVAFAPAKGGMPRFLSARSGLYYTHNIWSEYVERNFGWLERELAEQRNAAEANEQAFWRTRHEYARAWAARQPAIAVPANPAGFPANNEVDRFLNEKLKEKGLTPAEATDDLSFLRRASLDIIGIGPSLEEIEAFTGDRSPDKRRRKIDQLLAHPGWADHWVSYWQDVLAENPSILKPTLNNTGAFRFFIHDAFRRNKAYDRWVTELIRMEGPDKQAGTAGFAMASLNDAPMAAKAHVIAKAFLAAELKCARCHDAPNHNFTQQDLFSLAALLEGKTQVLPATSTVRVAPGARLPEGITITLKPGAKIDPVWSLEEFSNPDVPEGLLRKVAGKAAVGPLGSRERVAALLTRPENLRFARVAVNRLWHRFLGRGLVEPIDDWERSTPSHPGLLDWLARELVNSDYDLRHVSRLILNSAAYQRRVVGGAPLKAVEAYASATRRRMSAEQVVDSLFAGVGKEFDTEELNFDLGGSRGYLVLGWPRRSWEFASLSNERDRPSLAMPVALAFVDLLEQFGRRESRPDPATVREEVVTPLQPLTLSNGRVGRQITRLCEQHAVTRWSLQVDTPQEVIRRSYLQLLCREPSADELRTFLDLLAPHWEGRKTGKPAPALSRTRRKGVDWDKHLLETNNAERLEEEKRSRDVEPPTVRLNKPYREAAEDMVWVLVNSPEFLFLP